MLCKECTFWYIDNDDGYFKCHYNGLETLAPCNASEIQGPQTTTVRTEDIEENMIKDFQKTLDTTHYYARSLFRYLDEVTEGYGPVTKEHYKNKLLNIIKGIIIEGIKRNHEETMESINRVFNSYKED